MTKVTVTPYSVVKINRLPESWTLEDYKAIIDLLGGEYADLSDKEIEEYMQMMIADMDVPDSAYEVLKYALEGQLTEGQLRNLSNEMEDDKMWEEYPDMSFHKEIFKVNNLLYKAYNGKVPKGEALELELGVVSNNKEVIQLLVSKNEDAIFRLVLAGSNERSKLHRLFDEEEDLGLMADAKHILWHIRVSRVSDIEIKIKVVSSQYWLESFDAENTFVVNLDMDLYEENNHIDVKHS
jgi:hypothetical protein